MQLSIKEKLIVHISYRDVFNAPIPIRECKQWLGIDSHNSHKFVEAIDELKGENLISEKNGFLCVYGKEDIIDQQTEKYELTEELVAKGEKTLKFLSKLPFVRYIGISGSVAAKNPTLDIDRKGRKYIDLDIFVICRSNTLWLLFLIERVLTNFIKLFKGHHFYCFNYVTDETFLEIYNKNFYTATELINLRTIYDTGIYIPFIEKNNWYHKYYPEFNGNGNGIYKPKSASWTVIVAPINFICFAFFCIGRAIKRMEFDPILEIFEGFNPLHKCNLKRISNPNGGYQEAIKNKYSDLLKNNFPKYYSSAIMEYLFPASAAFSFMPEQNVYDKENAELFTKYQLSTDEKNSV